MSERMTLFYMKRNGAVRGYCTGEQTMSFYGEYEQDYSEIMSYIQVDYDQFIIDNREYYKVENDKLIFTKEVNN